MKCVKEEVSKWEALQLHGKQDNVVKMSVLSTLIDSFDGILITLPVKSFMGIWQTDTIVCLERQKAKNGQLNIEDWSKRSGTI